MNWTLLQNSLAVASAATIVALALGLVVALFALSLGSRWQSMIMGSAIIAFALPPFLVTNCWLHYLGQTGVWHAWLPLNIFSLGGTIWILALLLWPVSTFFALGAWRRVQSAHLESDGHLQGLTLIRFLLLPMGRSAAGQSAVLIFVLALNNFAVPTILQTRIFTEEIYVSANTVFDYQKALYLSWPLIAAPLACFFLLRKNELAWPRLEGGFPSRTFRRQLGMPWLAVAGLVSVAVIFFSVILPGVQLFAAPNTWTEFSSAYRAGQGALSNSLLLAAGTSGLVVILGAICARWPIGQILWIPFLVPGVLLSIAFIQVFNRPELAPFYGSVGIVVLAWAIRYCAIGWQGASLARAGVDPDLTAAAKLAGANRRQLFCQILWPQVSPLIFASGYLTYLLCLWDVESYVLIAPPGGETLSLRIFNLLHYGHNSQVNALCLLLLTIALLPLILVGVLKFAWSKKAALFPPPPLTRNLNPNLNLPLLVLSVPLLLTGCRPPPPENSFPLESQLFSRIEIIGTRGTGSGQFNKPRSVEVDLQDNLFVVDMTGRVQKFSSNGVFLLSWQMPQTEIGKPKGMCRDRAGNIVLVEPHYQRVNHFASDGKLVAQWGIKGTNAGQFGFPRAAAVNSHGEMYVSEYSLCERIQRFTTNGASFLMEFGKMGDAPGEFNRVEGLTVDSGDRLYVADSCNHRIQVFSREGKFLRTYGRAGNGRGEFSYPYDIRVDSQGRQFVCEFGNGRIQVFDSHDRLIEVIGSVGSGPGHFANPWSIALDSAGNLYVADSQNHRVQKLIRRKEDRGQIALAPIRKEADAN
jgi:ABC-type Fe3+ transport system permease subunit/streptogramin lyase